MLCLSHQTLLGEATASSFTNGQVDFNNYLCHTQRFLAAETRSWERRQQLEIRFYTGWDGENGSTGFVERYKALGDKG